MPYLAFDLDAKQRVPTVAKALGVSTADLGWALLEMWEHVWRTKRDVVPDYLLDAWIGPSDRVREVLSGEGFIERTDAGWRVKGADRYLRVSEARSRGGKKASGNLKQNRDGSRSEPEPSTGSLPAPAGREPVKSTGSAPALTSKIEHRASNTTSSPTREEAPPLGDALDEVFRQERDGAAYSRSHPDELKLADLMRKSNGDDAEIIRRWRLGLRRRRYPSVSTWTELEKHWNHCATEDTGPPVKAGRSNPAAPAAVSDDWSNQKTGTQDW